MLMFEMFQVAVLCQFLDEIDYTVAFKAFQERCTHDAADAYYDCIWDTTMLEYLIRIPFVPYTGIIVCVIVVGFCMPSVVFHKLLFSNCQKQMFVIICTFYFLICIRSEF